MATRPLPAVVWGDPVKSVDRCLPRPILKVGDAVALGPYLWTDELNSLVATRALNVLRVHRLVALVTETCDFELPYQRLYRLGWHEEDVDALFSPAAAWKSHLDPLWFERSELIPLPSVGSMRDVSFDHVQYLLLQQPLDNRFPTFNLNVAAFWWSHWGVRRTLWNRAPDTEHS